jgi:exosortase/archaeosortase family protein
MLKSLIASIKLFFTDPRWTKVRGVFWFCTITVLIHFSWRFWAFDLDYFPFNNLMRQLSQFFVDMVFTQSTWVISHILQIKITTSGHLFTCENNYGIIITDGCSGIKQIMQFALLMLIFPGPWKHKAWFIPLGMFIVHLTNVLRIVLLAIVAEHSPANIEYTHDSWLRIMFYVVIFALWLLWVEKIAVKKI